MGLVVGGTALDQLRDLRALFPRAWFLIPGVGAQGADMDSVMKYGRGGENGGLIINSSRAILYAGKGSDYGKKAGQTARGMQMRMKIYFE